MTVLYLVRHGVTSHTGHKLSGWMPGIHLSDEGRREAEAAAAGLEKLKFGAVYSSPIERCFETAEIVAEPHRVEVLVREDLGEVDYGAWTDRSFKMLRRTKLWGRVQRWPSGVRFPDGESLREVQARSVAALEDICSEHPRRSVCVVSHADVIRLVVAHYLGVHIDLFQRISIGPGSITILAVGDDGPKVVAVNVPPRGLVPSS
jgi:probable phosphomutase (TIGR03848 family)